MDSAAHTERLQVVLARQGVASRRGVVELIEAGEVSVNGKVVLEKGFRVDPLRDKIEFQGRLLSAEKPKLVYYLFYKPKGVTTTLSDPHAEKKVSDFFLDVPERIFPIGRLDRDTTGLLLLTNDGELSFRLSHPKYGIEKKYLVRVQGAISEDQCRYLEQGVPLEEGMTAPCRIKIDQTTDKETVLTVILHEGKKRQVRRMFDDIGHRVKSLERTQYGFLTIGDLRPGDRRPLRADEVNRLKKITGMVA